MQCVQYVYIYIYIYIYVYVSYTLDTLDNYIISNSTTSSGAWWVVVAVVVVVGGGRDAICTTSAICNIYTTYGSMQYAVDSYVGCGGGGNMMW